MAMTNYVKLDEYPIESTQKSDESDDSGKMFQIICPEDESPRADVRCGYRGPSGKFINNPPTFNPSQEVENEVAEKRATAFDQARVYATAIEHLQQAGVPDKRIPGALDLIENEEDIAQVVQLAK